MARVLAFVIALTAAAALGIGTSLFLSDAALGGTITGTVSLDYTSPVNLRGSDDFAVWGENSLTASAVKGTELLNYTLQQAGAGEYSLAYNGYAAVFGTGTSWTPGGIYWDGNQLGAGFSLTVDGAAMENRRLDIWVLTNGPIGVAATATSIDFAGNPLNSGTVALQPFKYNLLSFTGTGLEGPMVVRMTGTNSASAESAQFILGAAALVPLAVPEPEYWLAGLILAAGAGLYAAIVWGSALFVSKGDGDKRE